MKELEEIRKRYNSRRLSNRGGERMMPKAVGLQ